MQKTIETMRTNADQILREIAERRNSISQRMDQLEATIEADSPELVDESAAPEQKKAAAQQELRSLRRAERLHLVLNDRISRLRDMSDKGSGRDPMRRLIKGGLQEFLGLGNGNWRDGAGPGSDFRRPQPDGPDGDSPPPSHDFRPGGPRSGEPLIEQRLRQYRREAEDLRRRLKQIEKEQEELQRLTAPRPSVTPGNPNPPAR
jgi:hypothetical protein